VYQLNHEIVNDFKRLWNHHPIKTYLLQTFRAFKEILAYTKMNQNPSCKCSWCQ